MKKAIVILSLVALTAALLAVSCASAPPAQTAQPTPATKQEPLKAQPIAKKPDMLDTANTIEKPKTEEEKTARVRVDEEVKKGL